LLDRHTQVGSLVLFVSRCSLRRAGETIQSLPRIQ
jgi:hypothetical protein